MSNQWGVSSYFVEQARLTHPVGPVRRFFVGSDDYSDRVDRWPTFKVKWDQVRSVKVSLTLANDDGGMNFFKNNKINMKKSCVLQMGFHSDDVWDIDNFRYMGERLQHSIQMSELKQICFAYDSANNKTYLYLMRPLTAHQIIYYELNERGGVVIGSKRFVGTWEESDITVGYPESTLWVANDGGKLYIGSAFNKKVLAYTNSTPYLLSLGVPAEFDTSGEIVGAIQAGLAFDSNESRMIIMDQANEKVYLYHLSTPGDIATASFSSTARMDILSEEAEPKAVAFSSDGTKAYIVGNSNDTIYQYTLTTPWDINTGSYASKSMSVNSEESQPTAMTFSSDGTKVYIVGVAADTIYQYTLTTPWDINTGSYASKSMSVASEEINSAGLVFSSDGTKAYIVGYSADTIYQYTLTTPWDISTGSYASKNFSIASEETGPTGLAFSSDGTKAYILGIIRDTIYQYTLTTPWDISTGVYASKNFSIFDQETNSAGLVFSSDGTRCYFTGITNGTTVLMYQLSTAWDINTASIGTNSFTLTSSSPSEVQSIDFREDGTSFIVAWAGDAASIKFQQYNLSQPWSLGSAVLSASYNPQTDDDSAITIPTCLRIHPDERLAYVMSGSYLYRYDMHKSEVIDLFKGTVDKLKLSKGNITLSLADKFKAFSERVIGSSDAPVTYQNSNYLLSDIAWWLCTSYGGLDTTTSTANVDINWDTFAAWSGVFSGDSVYLNARFTGMKVTEALKKLARISQSAIFQENDRLNFHRFTTASSYTETFGHNELKNLSLEVDDKDIINRQYMGLDYDVSSRFHQSTVLEENLVSINSYGLREVTFNDKSMWYVNSQSAINYVQRITATKALPYDKLMGEVTLTGMLTQIGDMVIVTDEQIEVTADSYRVMERSINMDSSIVTFKADASQILNAFILDVSALDGTDVLL